MRNFCSLFDSAYFTRGLVLYESLVEHCSEPFTLFILPMDDAAAEMLQRLELPGVMMVTDFHQDHPGMAGTMKNRTWQEYCWTCASNLCEALMLAGLEEITYLDADMMFFSDPEVIFKEIGTRSIAVIPHRLIPSKKHLELNGRFNVCWITLKNLTGFECVIRWARQCRERCSAVIGCGDQVYLDEWPALYGSELAIIENIGAGLAPWNLANYALYEHSFTDQVIVSDPSMVGTSRSYTPVVFYHYHEFTEKEDGSFHLTNYELRPDDIRLIYEPYLAAYRAARERARFLMVN